MSQLMSEKYSMNSIPSKKDLELAFEEFNHINWNVVTLENIKEIIPYPLRALGIMHFPYENKKYFYRARTFSSFHSNFNKNDNVFLVKSFSYPPKDKTELNRANWNNFPVFYAASNILVSEMEMKKNENYIFISCWKSKKELIVIPFINSLISKSNNAKEIKDKISNSFKIQFGKDIHKAQKILDEFNQKQFSKRIEKLNDYKYSAWNSYRYLYELRDRIKIDAIAYPTILNTSKGINFAIHPEFVDSYMELECVYLINYKLEIKNNAISATRNPIRIGIPEDGLVLWRNLTKIEQDFFTKHHHVPEFGFHKKK